MAAGGAGYGNIGYPTTYPGYSGRGHYAGVGGGGYGRGGFAPGSDYGRDYEFGAGAKRVNPEYHYRERGYGYEGTKADAFDPYEDSQSKKRKLDNVTICVDYVRGFCSRGARCPKPHVDYVESIDEREILAKSKFCHDFQNKGQCTRNDCKFLHVTRREEDEFLLTGTIPQDVFDRMQHWTSGRAPQEPGFGSFGPANNGTPPPHGNFYPPPRGRPFGPRGRGRGGVGRGGMGGGRGGGGMGRPPGFSPGGGGSRRQSGSGGMGHSSSQPVTYGNLCVDFLKGTCAKGEACDLKHVETLDDVSEREGVVQQVFCHDFLNSTCHRPFCKFLHANRTEESFFLENGYFPPSLNTKNKNKLFFSNVCIDFLRSQCTRSDECQYKHVEKVEAHNERICLSRSIFCHDYQEEGCDRPSCKLIHTVKEDEQYFLRTGSLPQYLKANAWADLDLSSLQSNVCREFVRNNCTWGANCRFYHPTPRELQSLLEQQTESNKAKAEAEKANEALQKENTELKARVQQLERLLADACHCITLAVGDQNPDIAVLMKTIADMAPSSSLANQQDEEAAGSGAAPGGDGGGDGTTGSVVKTEP